MAGMVTQEAQLDGEKHATNPKPDSVSERVSVFGAFAFNELMKGGKVVRLSNEYFTKVLPDFAKVWNRFPRGIFKACRDGTL